MNSDQEELLTHYREFMADASNIDKGLHKSQAIGVLDLIERDNWLYILVHPFGQTEPTIYRLSSRSMNAETREELLLVFQKMGNVIRFPR